jgi:thymidylate kinase
VGSDRFELKNQGLPPPVAEGYHRFVAEDPDLWRVVDGTGTVEEVAGLVWAAAEPRLVDG